MKAFLGGAKKYFIQNSVFIIFLVLIAVLSFTKFTQTDGDFWYFSGVALDKLTDFTAFRYQSWTSRNIIEVVLVFCCHFPYIFAVLNIFFCGLLYKSILGVASKKKSRQLEFIVATSILASLIPASLNSAGYIPTIINYLWPVSALAYVIYILKLITTKKHLAKHQYVFAALAAIFSANSEQCAALLFGALVVCIGYLLFRRKKAAKFSKFIYVLLAISIASLVHIAICPGNAQRVIVETEVHFPGFVNLGLFDKVLLGFSDIVTDMFAVVHPFYIAGLIILGITIIHAKKTFRKPWFGILVSLPAFVLAGALLFEYLYHETTGSFFLTRIPNFAQHGDTLIYPLAMLLSVVILTAYLVYCFYLLCKKKVLFVATLSVFLIAGILSKVIIGFSPSIFASGFRTTMPLFIALVFIFCMLFSERQSKIRTTEAKLTYSLIGVAALVNIVLLFR